MVVVVGQSCESIGNSRSSVTFGPAQEACVRLVLPAAILAPAAIVPDQFAVGLELDAVTQLR